MKLSRKISIPFGIFIIIVFIMVAVIQHENFSDHKSMIELVLKTKNTKASIDDFKFFENVKIEKSSSPKKWAKHKLYNKLESTKELDSIHNE